MPYDDYAEFAYPPEEWDFEDDLGSDLEDFTGRPTDFGLGYDAGLCGEEKLPPENVDKAEWINGWNEGNYDRNYK